MSNREVNMRLVKKISFTMWPVGQGLFTQANFWINDNVFRIVYDCGTQYVKKEETDVFPDAMKNKDIDLLVVSHFHFDHISLLPQLFDNKSRVKEAWIPYFEPKQRILFVISNFIRFVIENDNIPYEEIKDISSIVIDSKSWFESRGCFVREICSGNEFGDNKKINTSNIVMEDLKKATDVFKLKSKFVAGKSCVKINLSTCKDTVAEIITWANPISKDKTNDLWSFMVDLLRCVDESIIINDVPDDKLQSVFVENGFLENIYGRMISFVNTKEGRKKIQGAYKKINKDLNSSSIFVLARPIVNSNRYTVKTKILESPGILWTGDAPKFVLDKITGDNGAKSWFKKAVGWTFIHQFPHHGSRSSVSSDWLKAISNDWRHCPVSVFSVGEKNSYGHPTKEAVIACRNAMVVAEKSPPLKLSLPCYKMPMPKVVFSLNKIIDEISRYLDPEIKKKFDSLNSKGCFNSFDVSRSYMVFDGPRTSLMLISDMDGFSGNIEWKSIYENIPEKWIDADEWLLRKV